MLTIAKIDKHITKKPVERKFLFGIDERFLPIF
jgi:hypothetical protein